MADDLSRYLTIFAWKGVEFPGTDATLTFGNDTAKHSPYLGPVSVEPTGPRAKVVRVRAVLNNALRGWRGDPLFPTVYERLVAALEGEPEGFLTHPTRGVFRAVFDEATEEIRSADKRGLSLMLSFTEQDGEAEFEARAELPTDPGAVMLTQAAAADLARPAGLRDQTSLVDDVAACLAFLEEVNDEARSFVEAAARLDAVALRVQSMVEDPAAAVVDAHPFRQAGWGVLVGIQRYREVYAALSPREFVVPVAMGIARIAALPEVYGDPSRARDLLRANAIATPARVPAGTRLVVPE